MLRAYTDTSRRDNTTAGVAILLSDDTFIDYSLIEFYKVSNSAKGELLAIILALRLVNNNYSTPQEVDIYSDCEDIVIKCNRCLKTKVVKRKWRFYNSWLELLDVAGEHTVRVHHTKGHQRGRSLNVLCDLGVHHIVSVKKGLQSVEKQEV